MLWPSIKQPKSMQILQTQVYHALAFMATLFHNITWLAYKRDTPSDATSSRPYNLPATKLICFSNLYDALKAHVHSKLKLGQTNPTTGNYSYHSGLLPLAHKNIIQSVLENEDFHQHNDTLFNQKHAVRFKTSTSLQCPLCHNSDRALQGS